MKAVNGFESDDGKFFASAEECKAYEQAKALRDSLNTEIAEFKASPFAPYKQQPFATVQSSVIVAWESFKADKEGVQQ